MTYSRESQPLSRFGVPKCYKGQALLTFFRGLGFRRCASRSRWYSIFACRIAARWAGRLALMSFSTTRNPRNASELFLRRKTLTPQEHVKYGAWFLSRRNSARSLPQRHVATRISRLSSCIKKNLKNPVHIYTN